MRELTGMSMARRGIRIATGGGSRRRQPEDRSHPTLELTPRFRSPHYICSPYIIQPLMSFRIYPRSDLTWRVCFFGNIFLKFSIGQIENGRMPGLFKSCSVRMRLRSMNVSKTKLQLPHKQDEKSPRW
ncbi:hypothetical protein J6590_024087 [Homalodisca vitripennis]|nr:hypothetical protein J6590_024087 [Homalodisca vitripennis]